MAAITTGPLALELGRTAAPDRQIGAGGRSSCGDNLGGAFDAGSSGEAPIARHERAVQSLGEPDIRGVVRSDVRTQVVGAEHQRAGWEANDGECSEILDCRTKSSCCQPTGEPSLAKDGHGLDIDQIRCCDAVCGRESRSRDSSRGTVIADDVGQH